MIISLIEMLRVMVTIFALIPVFGGQPSLGISTKTKRVNADYNDKFE
ncbi:hypothetical protein [Mucilaginibacter conchicola]|nr:hypothetical protein [Mucilaginibacter conchicola]